jgi:hypothetical protein
VVIDKRQKLGARKTILGGYGRVVTCVEKSCADVNVHPSVESFGNWKVMLNAGGEKRLKQKPTAAKWRGKIST